MHRNRLRFALRWAGLSQNQAAKAAGILPQRITDDLAGRRALPQPQVKAFAAVLGIEAAWLDQPSAPSPPPPMSSGQTNAPEPSGQTNAVAGLLRPIRTSLMLLTWGEALVLYRSLRSNAQGIGIDGEVSRALMQRLLCEVGVDEATMAAAAEIVGQLSRMG